MPLAGTVCCQTGQPQDFDHCMQCATTGEPGSCEHPFFLIKAMRDNRSSREGAGLSATTLQQCDRFVVLSNEHDYYESPAAFQARFRGTIIHGGIEKFAGDTENIIAEKRFYRDIEVPFVDADGVIHRETYTISGQMDIIHTNWNGGVKLSDVKSGGSRSLRKGMAPLDSHTEQVNIYRWILANGRPQEPTIVTTPTREGDVVTESYDPVAFDVVEASIWYIKDGGMLEVPVPLWSLAETEEHIRELIADGKGYKLPPILPSSWKLPQSSDIPVEVRHWKCDRCPLRGVCDSLPREGIPWFAEDRGSDSPG